MKALLTIAIICSAVGASADTTKVSISRHNNSDPEFHIFSTCAQMQGLYLAHDYGGWFHDQKPGATTKVEFAPPNLKDSVEQGTPICVGTCVPPKQPFLVQTTDVSGTQVLACVNAFH